MNLQSKYADTLLNLLIAVAISLVVNFSYLLIFLVDQKGDPSPRSRDEPMIEVAAQGQLRLHPDGHGYLLYAASAVGMDSIYVPMSRIRRLGLLDGDELVIKAIAPRTEGAHYALAEVEMRNGEPFDYSTVFNRPSRSLELLLQLLYYMCLSFIIISILTTGKNNYAVARFVQRCAWACAAVAALYLIAPVTEWRSGRIVMNFIGGHYLDYMLLLKCSFAVVVSILYGWIYRLIYQRQAVVVENEQLKNENLTTRYNMLVSQINPHFFFNSLNSLAMLVREGLDQKALTYIDQLSYTFRYIIQNGQSTLMTLDQELKFAEAYIYLFKIRYADKLFFDLEIQECYRSWLLPAMSLQPLIDNAVKHNMITRSKPFHISIRTEAGYLIISNPKVPKLEAEPSTGIGLENLDNRWHLITHHHIDIMDGQTEFTVRLPLQNPTK